MVATAKRKRAGALSRNPRERVIDPLKMRDLFWPHIKFYDKQIEIIRSVWYNTETIVPAGNMLGKDFIGGFIVLAFFMSRYPCRIVTTSVRDDHLDVLWGEMNRFIQDAKFAIRKEDGGPLIVNHHEIKRWNEIKDKEGNVIGGEEAPLCYVKGMVTGEGEGLAGHHIANVGDGVPRTMMVVDEASSSYQEVYDQSQKWANRIFAFGNCWQCSNWWRQAIEGRIGAENEYMRKGGDIPNDDGTFQRKIIKIRAKDSPNVQRALRQIELGQEPDDRVILPGVKSWGEYQKNLKFWDPENIAVGLNAEFYKGGANYLYPEDWLKIAEDFGNEIKNKIGRKALAIGVDCAEGVR